MKPYALTGLALIVGLAISCNRGTNSVMKTKATANEASPAAGDADLKELAKEEDKSSEPPQLPSKTKNQSPIPAPMEWEKKIVRNADMTMRVKDFNAAGRLIKTAVQVNSGYIAGSNEQQLANQVRGDVTIKVPREKFDELLERIQASGDSLIQKEITSEDLTEEFVDTKARIRAKEKVRERYYEFLKKAGTIKDVLAVEADLRELDEEIESATGRTNYISHEAALNTIHLVYFQMIPGKIEPDLTPGYATLVFENFKKGLDFLKQLLLILVALWPFALVTVFLVWLYRRQKRTKVVTNVAHTNAN